MQALREYRARQLAGAPPTRGAGSAADTLHSRCAFYRDECGLNARVDPLTERIVVTSGSTLAAVTVPAELAGRARIYMQHRGITVGPIISHPRSSRWTFLVRPDVPTDPAAAAPLFARQVSVIGPGTPIALPSPGPRQAGYRCWVHPPTDGLPSGLVVVRAVCACAPLDRYRPGGERL
ncbi:DNA-directed RNA polymerase subunit beta [Nocardia farcinica]|uniref:DNA-directed RNA polymerase subunit beta n=1 Tax=Nocardia farcinica TaxID=37329 RepID=UPI001E56D397|nr:DNA-directed RNA polymerase subunit beta [Nocardia farcinica]MCZ9330242.1 DNA-directed RNA polymerase subunit beta [Nocardia farcinica]UEX26220.1 DNA-directed RNA polymerase subunit beta [Nocardia farcinica]